MRPLHVYTRVHPHVYGTCTACRRRYEFGLFCPVFRTHGCRNGPSEPDEDPCRPAQGSCGGNEVWSYGAAAQPLLEKLVRARADTLLPYIKELAANVSARGVPTMRPLWWEFDDPAAADVDDQYLLGSRLLVAPVVVQHATERDVVFPAGACTAHAHRPHHPLPLPFYHPLPSSPQAPRGSPSGTRA